MDAIFQGGTLNATGFQNVNFSVVARPRWTKAWFDEEYYWNEHPDTPFIVPGFQGWWSVYTVCSTLSPLLDLWSITDTLLELNIPVVWINRLRKQDPHEEGPVYNTASELQKYRVTNRNLCCRMQQKCKREWQNPQLLNKPAWNHKNSKVRF